MSFHIELAQNFFHACGWRDDKVHGFAKGWHVGLQESLAHFFGHHGQVGLRVQIVARVIGEDDGDLLRAAVSQRKASA